MHRPRFNANPSLAYNYSSVIELKWAAYIKLEGVQSLSGIAVYKNTFMRNGLPLSLKLNRLRVEKGEVTK